MDELIGKRVRITYMEDVQRKYHGSGPVGPWCYLLAVDMPMLKLSDREDGWGAEWVNVALMESVSGPNPP